MAGTTLCIKPVLILSFIKSTQLTQDVENMEMQYALETANAKASESGTDYNVNSIILRRQVVRITPVPLVSQ